MQNEMLKDMSLSMLRDGLLEATKSSDYHSIMADESSDVSNKEQAVLCVCWVDEDLISHEDFIGLCKMGKTDPQVIATMVTVIKEAIL